MQRLVRTVVLAGACLFPLAAAAQRWPGTRLDIGPGTVLLTADSVAGVTLWAMRPAEPGHRPPPDFVGWFNPAGVAQWVAEARLLLRAPPTAGEPAQQTSPLMALEGGTVSLAARAGQDPGQPEFLLAFGHPSERSRWAVTGSAAEFEVLFEALTQLALRARLDVASGLGYANPTHRRTTPDRQPANPALEGLPGPGEVWLRMELDQDGGIRPGSEVVLWATSPRLGAAVAGRLGGIRYLRHDGGRPARLVVYQRVRAKPGGSDKD